MSKKIKKKRIALMSLKEIEKIAHEERSVRND